MGKYLYSGVFFPVPTLGKTYLAYDWQHNRWWAVGKVHKFCSTNNMYSLEVLYSSHNERWSRGVMLPVWIDELSPDYPSQKVLEE